MQRSITQRSQLGALVTVLTVLVVGTRTDVANGQAPALTLPGQEKPLEPGDAAQMYEAMVPRADLRYDKKEVEILGTKIAYVDEGRGNPIVFLHGAPESAMSGGTSCRSTEAWGAEPLGGGVGREGPGFW